jgi:hypothetical protein
MANPSDEPSVESLLGVLRSDVAPIAVSARQRIGSRLESGVVAELVASSLAPSFISRGLLHSKAFAVAVALPLGVAIGVGGHAWVTSRHAAEEQAARKVELAAQPLPARELTPVLPAPVAPPPAPVPLDPPAPSRPPVFRVRSAPSSSKVLNRELSQLEKARTLLSEGHAAATLSLLRAHQWRYPRSALEQERQALYIKALVAADRMAEARTRAAAFVRRFPKSALRGSVENAVAPIP